MSNYYVHKNYTVDSVEGFNVTHFTSWTNAFNASKNGDTITIVADGGQVGYPPKDLYRHVVVESGSTFAFQLRLFKIKDSVTIKAGATFKVLPHGNIINPYTHIDTGELYVGEKGATERATMNFDTNSISTLYSSIWECYNADIIVGDLGAVGKTSFNDSTIEVKGSLSFAAGSQSSIKGGHSLVNSTLTAKGHSLRGDSTYFSAGCNRIAGLTMDNSTITIDDGVDGTVADVVELGVLKSDFLNQKKDLILTNNSKIIVENGTQINLLYNVSLSDSKIEGGNFSIISGNLTMTGKSSLEIAALDIAANQKIVIDNTSSISVNALTGTGTIEINIVDKLSGLDQVIDLADGADTTGLLDRISVKQDGYSAIIKDGDIYVASYLYVGKAPEGTSESDIYTNIADALAAANGRVVQISGRFVDVDQATMTAIENGNVKFAAGTMLFLAEGVTTTLTDENLTIKDFGVKANLTDGVVDLATDNAVATGSIGNTDTNIELTTGSATEGTAEVRGEVSGKDVTISNSKDLAITGSVTGSNVIVNNADNAVIDGGSDDYSAKFTADEKITFVNDGHAVVDMSAKNIEVENNSVNTITNSTIGYDENGNVIAETVVIDAKENANGVISASKIGAKNITIADQTVTDSEVNANKTNGTLYLKDANTFNNTDAVANNVWIGFQNTKNDIPGSLELENGATVTTRTQIVIGENSSLTVDNSSYVETQTDVLQVRGEATFNGGLADDQKVSQELTATAKEDVQANLNYFQIYPTGTMTLEDGACVAVKAYNKIWGNLNIDNSRLEIASGEKNGSWGWLTNPVANNFGGLWIAEGGAVSVDNGSLLAVGGVYRNQGFGLKNEAEITIDNGSKVVVAFNAVNANEINISNGASIVVGNNFANDTQTAHTDFGFVNDGVINITMDAEDLTDGVDNVNIDAKSITGSGTIIIDATKFAGGVDKVINVSDANDVKIEFKEGTVRDGVEFLVNNGDVFVSDVKYNTIYVDANFEGEYGDAVGEGKYLGVNAFNEFTSAMHTAIDKGTTEIKVNSNISEVLKIDQEFVVSNDITFTADKAVTIALSNENTEYDLILNSNNNNKITFGKNVTLTLDDRTIWAGYYGNNVDIIIEGTVSGYQWWNGADTTVQNGGKLITSGEALVLRRGATLTILGDNSADTVELDANYFSMLSGTLNATNATIDSGAIWSNNTGGYANESGVIVNLNNTTWTSSGNLKLDGENVVFNITNNSNVSVTDIDGYGASTVSEKSQLNINGATFNDKSLNNNGTITVTGGKLNITKKLTNNKTITVTGESTLNITELTGSITLLEGAIVKNSTIGGTVSVVGNVIFRGKNTFNMITDYGPAYNSTYGSDAKWTVEEGASVKLTNSGKYGLGYGDNVTINGKLKDAKVAYEAGLIAEDASLIATGGIIAQTNSSYADSITSFTTNDAYIRIGKEGYDKSFDNRQNTDGASGKYEFSFNNSVIDCNSFEFKDTEGLGNGNYHFTLTDSVFVAGGASTFNDTDSTFTADNSLIEFTNSFTNAGTITLSDDSLMTVAGSFTNNGTIEITISDKFIGTKTIIDVNNAPTTEYGTINITGANDVISTKNEDGDLVIYKVDTKTLFVDTAWEELENGTEIATNLVKGVNAFTNVNDAMVVAQEKGGATIVLANIPGASASVTDNTAIWRTNGTYTFTGGDYYNFNSWIQTPKSSEDYKDVDVNIVFDNAKVVVGKFRLDTGSTLTINNTHMDGTSYTGDGRTWLTFYGDSKVTITNSVVGYNTAYNTGNSDAIVAGDKETDYSNIKGMMTFYGSGVMNVTNSTLFGFSAPGNGAVFGVTDKGLFTVTDSALYGGSIAIGIDDNVTVGRDNEVATMILDNSKFTYINGDYQTPYAQKITVGDAKAGNLIVRNNSEIDFTNAEAKEVLVNSNGEVEISNSKVSANSVTNNGAISIDGGSLTTDALKMELPTSVVNITNGTLDVGTYTSSNTISQAGTFVVKKGTATDAATIIIDKATTNVFVKGEYGVLKDANIGGILSVRGHLNFTGNTKADAIYLGFEGNTINNLEDMSFNITGTVLTKNTAHGGNKDVIYTINYTDALINSSTVNNINGAKVKYTNSSIISNSEFNAGTFVTFENSYADVFMQIYPLSHNEIDYKTLEVKVDNSTIIDRAGEFGSFAHETKTAYRASLNIVNDSYYKVTGNGKYGQGCYLLGEDVKVTVNNSAFITVNEMKNNGTIYITGNSAVNGAFTGTGSIILENANLVEKSFDRSYDVLNSNGEIEKVEVNDIVNTSISSNVTAYGTNNISGNTYISSLRLGYEATQTGSTTVNITGTYDGSFIVGNKNTDKSVYTLNIGTQDGEKTIVAKANAGSILNVYASNGAANIVNTTYYMEQLYNRGTVTVSNSNITLTKVNNYIYGRDGGTAKLTLTNSNWDAENNINSEIAIGSSSYNGNAEGSAIVTFDDSNVEAYKLGLNNAGSYKIELNVNNTSTLTVVADTFIGTNASMNLTASTFSSNNLINNGSLTVNGGTLSITNAIQNSGAITLSNTVNGNITIEGTGSTTLSDKAVIADSLNANIAIKGTASLDADAKFTGSIISGALKVTGNGNTLNITDSSNATIIAGENAVLGSDDVIGNVAIKGETKQTALTVDASILNGNQITDVALTINGIKEITSDVEIKGNFNLDILKSVIINDVEYQVLNFLGKYYSNATDDFNYYFNKVENGIDISSEAVSGSQEDAPLVENQKSFTISESADLGDAAIEMKKGTTTVTIKKGVEFTIGDIQKSTEGGLNNVTVSNEAKLTVNGTIDRLNNITVGKTATVTMNSEIIGTSGNQAIKLGEKSTGNFEDIDLAGGKNTISLGKNAELNANDLIDITSLTLADYAQATIEDFVVSELNNTISLGKFANLTVNGNILTSCGDNYEFDANGNLVVNFAGNVGSTIKLGNDATIEANSIVGLANFTIGNAATATVKDVYGTTKNNTISVGKAATLTIGDVNLFDGKDTLKTSESANLTAGALTSVETVTIGKYTTANIGDITGVNKLTVTAGGVVSKVEKFTSLTAKDIVATTGKDSINVGKLNIVKFNSINLLEGNDTIKIADQSEFEVTNDVAFGEGKDTLTVGKNSTFKAASVSGVENITFGAASNIEITGVVSDVNKLTIANNLKNSTSTIKTSDVKFADVKASLNIGNLNNVTTGDITFGNNNDTLKIGSDSYVTAGDVIFGEGKNTLDLGKNATFVVDTISGITNFKAATYSLLIVNNGTEDVVFDKEMTGSWSKASIADYQGDITTDNITGSVYNNEFDAFTLNLADGQLFAISNWSDTTDIFICKYDETTNTWGEWSNDITNIETGSLLLDQAGKYAIGVIVSDSQFGKDPLEKETYSFDAKLLLA